MKVKLLKKLRKYWDYKFEGNGVIIRRKADGELRPYNSIYNFVRSFGLHNASYTDWSNWENKKVSMRNNRIWNNIKP